MILVKTKRGHHLRRAFKTIENFKKTFSGGQPGPCNSTLIEVGGSGECGWRALALMIAMQNQKRSSIENVMDKIEVLSTSLGMKTVSFFGKPSKMARQIGGRSTMSFYHWGRTSCQKCFWVSGRLWQTQALDMRADVAGLRNDPTNHKCGLGIQWHTGSLQSRSWMDPIGNYHKGGHERNLPIIPGVLNYGHYYNIPRLPTGKNNWPRDWTQDQQAVIPTSQDVKGTEKICGTLRGGGDLVPSSEALCYLNASYLNAAYLNAAFVIANLPFYFETGNFPPRIPMVLCQRNGVSLVFVVTWGLYLE